MCAAHSTSREEQLLLGLQGTLDMKSYAVREEVKSVLASSGRIGRSCLRSSSHSPRMHPPASREVRPAHTRLEISSSLHLLLWKQATTPMSQPCAPGNPPSYARMPALRSGAALLIVYVFSVSVNQQKSLKALKGTMPISFCVLYDFLQKLSARVHIKHA